MMKLDEILKDMNRPIDDMGFTDQVMLKIILEQKPKFLPFAWVEIAWSFIFLILGSSVLWLGSRVSASTYLALIFMPLHEILPHIHNLANGAGLVVTSGLALYWVFIDEEIEKISPTFYNTVES